MSACPDCGTELLEAKIDGENHLLDPEPHLAIKLDQKVKAPKDVAGVKFKGGPSVRFLTGKVIQVFGPHTERHCNAVQQKRASESGIVLPKPQLVVPE